MIRIGEEITVTIVSVKDGVATLGVCAPKTTPVHREEVRQRIEQARAAKKLPTK